MKLNKKTNKIILQKKDHEKQFIFLNGYIAINGNYIIKADLVEFESDLIQEKINKNEYFSLLDGKNTNFPTESTWQAILSKEEGKPVRVHNIYYEKEIGNKTKRYNLLTNIANNKTIVIDEDFSKIIKSLRGNVTQSIKSEFQPVTVHKDGVLIGLFMPMGDRKILSDINQFIIDNTSFIYEDAAA